MAAKKTSKTTGNESANDVKFEDAMSELESLIEQMESEELALDDLVSSFERGTKLWKLCQSRLDDARLKVEAISNRSSEDELVVEDFDESAPTETGTKTEKPKAADKADEINLF